MVVTKKLVLLPVLSFAALAAVAEVAVDFSAVTGPVKPVNGVGQPPLLSYTGTSLFRYLKEAGIPYSRLHDVGGSFGKNVFVDIPNVFRDFDADENDPANYDFALTDMLLKALEQHGVEPYFRLGVTIENAVEQGYPAYRISPPKDFAKWARVSERVIRHYTEGWANGFRMKITYWEIWGEPDNNPRVDRNPLWRAPFEEYIRFYGTVAPYLKAKFPHLKIGGYGSCGFYAGSAAGQVREKASARAIYWVDCAKRFLARTRDEKWPLDFFSYHSYSTTFEAIRQMRYADELLTEYGFTREKTERHLNEWLPYVSHQNLGSALQAAGVAAELVALQNGPCDVACLYDARCGLGDYSPLFNPMTYKPHKAYCAFLAFNELRKLGQAVKVTGSSEDGDGEGLWVTAATDGKGKCAVLAVNLSEKPLPLPDFAAGRAVRARLIDEKSDFAETVPGTTLGGRSVVLIEFKL